MSVIIASPNYNIVPRIVVDLDTKPHIIFFASEDIEKQCEICFDIRFRTGESLEFDVCKDLEEDQLKVFSFKEKSTTESGLCIRKGYYNS